MVTSIHRLLVEHPVGLLFVILSIGYLIGKTRVRGFELGPVTGVLFAGLVFGHLGHEFPPIVQTFGFVTFIFSVGFQAGPRFFEVVRQDGIKYLFLSLSVAATGFALAALFAGLFEFPAGISAGLLAGAMTTTPTLAAAQDALESGAVALPEGIDAAAAVANVSTAYAITYLFGLVGLILIIRILPGLLKLDLHAEAEKIGGKQAAPDPSGRVSVRAYRVEFEHRTGIPYGELRARFPHGAIVVRLRRDGELLEVDEKTTFELGDEVAVVGTLERFVAGAKAVGPEIDDPELLDMESEAAQIVVMRPDAVGKTLGETGIAIKFGCLLTGLARMQVDLPVEPGTKLQRGDILSVTGPSGNLEALAQELGHLERPVVETDLLTLAVGIALGILIGMFSVTIGGVSIGLGTAGGLLTTGLVIGYLRSVRPTFGRIPTPVRWVFMELGLQMFMAGVGVSAGAGILETLGSVGPSLVLCGIAVTVLPVAVGWVLGSLVLRLNPAVLLGAITGAMTSGAALSVVNSAARSTVPALGYTGAYAFANVILTVAGSLIVHF